MIPLARIATLIPSLGRDNDHEVLATARAIGAALVGAGHDFHDLACVIGGRPAKAETAARNSAAWAPSHRARQAKSDRDRATWLSLYAGAALSEWEAGFVDSLMLQLNRRGASIRQSERLGQIFFRVTQRAA